LGEQGPRVGPFLRLVVEREQAIGLRVDLARISELEPIGAGRKRAREGDRRGLIIVVDRDRPVSGAPPPAGTRLADENVMSTALRTSSRVGFTTSRSIATVASKVSCCACGVTVTA
jgi:hypothetical protein